MTSKLESRKILGVVKFPSGKKSPLLFTAGRTFPSIGPRDFLDSTCTPSKFTGVLGSPPEALFQLPSVFVECFLIKSLVS